MWKMVRELQYKCLPEHADLAEEFKAVPVTE